MGCLLLVVMTVSLIIVPRLVYGVTSWVWGPLRVVLVFVSAVGVCAFWQQMWADAKRPPDG